VRSGPIIEHSRDVRFGPYVPSYSGASAKLEAQGLDGGSDEWSKVQDFGWLRATASPHWRVLNEEEREPDPDEP